MRKFFRRLVLVLITSLAAYVLWPRSPSLSAFRPDRIEAFRIEAIGDARADKTWASLVPLYRIFQEEFRFSPVAAAQCAWETSRALRFYLDSADNADRERALAPLEKMFEIMRRQIGVGFEPAVAARLELSCWMLAGDMRKETQLRAAIAEKLALLHGGSASEFAAAAAAFAKADRLVMMKNQHAAREAGVSAWRRLSEQLKRQGGGE